MGTELREIRTNRYALYYDGDNPGLGHLPDTTWEKSDVTQKVAFFVIDYQPCQIATMYYNKYYTDEQINEAFDKEVEACLRG